MIIEKRIKEFEKLGFGMFVHFGLYSILGKGEWSKHIYKIPDNEYEPLKDKFEPDTDWAEKLAETARNTGCKYITLTTRHHDGFSLYDTKGMNDYDAPHSKCRRDIVKEFVDACNKHGIIPFFYHTLLDWYNKDYVNDFNSYLEYLRKSIEILCTNYGKIGGFWFDGMWDKKNADWQEDALYGVIRKYQPDAMIINNTGLYERGAKGHIEIDSTTFERGRPEKNNNADTRKYLAAEMCQTLGCTWGYGAEDIDYKSPATLIGDLCCCRRYGANLLLNVGPMPNGTLRALDPEILKVVGKWTTAYGEAIYNTVPTDIKIENKSEDFILKGENCYYLFVNGVGMGGDGNVVISDDKKNSRFCLNEDIKNITWLDNNTPALFTKEQDVVTVNTAKFAYGTNYIVRVAKIEI